MRSRIPLGAFLCCLALSTVPSHSAAQIEIHTRLSAQFGLVSARGRLYDLETSAAESSYGTRRSWADLRNYASVGVSLDAGDPGLGIWLKARVSRSIGLEADFTGTSSYECTADQHYCSFLTTLVHDRRLDTSITDFGVDLALPTRLSIGPVEPFVIAGWGARHYHFSLPDRSEWQGFSLPGDGTRWSFRVGGGMDFWFKGRSYCLSVIDAMSRYPIAAMGEDPGRLRHHVFVELGIPVVTKRLFAP